MKIKVSGYFIHLEQFLIEKNNDLTQNLKSNNSNININININQHELNNKTNVNCDINTLSLDKNNKYRETIQKLKLEIENNKTSFIDRYSSEISYFIKIFIKETDNSKYLDLITERWKLDVFTLINDTIKFKV